MNVRVIGPDGVVYPVEMAHAGLDERGFNVWEATTIVPVQFTEGFRVKADEVPPRSAIRVMGAKPES